MKKFFITGTDTDCGKTYISSRLAQLLNSAIVIKPIASGCEQQEGQLVNQDALIHQKHAQLPMDLVNPWKFKSAVSPHLAAKEEGCSLDIESIASYCMDFTFPGLKTLLIEGAGGLMVPLNNSSTWVDFLRITKIPVILVVGMKLGCLNHALLTQSAFGSNGIECVGWIANCIDPHMLMPDENIDTLKTMLPFPLLGIARHGAEIEIGEWDIFYRA